MNIYVHFVGVDKMKSYPGYCLVSTSIKDNHLKVYISKHTPSQDYLHFNIWFGVTPNDDNLFCTIPLADVEPENVQSVINFFSPEVSLNAMNISQPNSNMLMRIAVSTLF